MTQNRLTPLTIVGLLIIFAVIGIGVYFIAGQGTNAGENATQNVSTPEQAQSQMQPDNQSETATPARQDIIDTAVSAGQFTTLAAALEATDLVDTLKGSGPFTVFAPTDEAFAKLPQGTAENLLQNPAQLRQILLYHVVEGSVTSQQALDLGEAQTVNGQSVSITTNGTDVHINDASVTTADVRASNGVIHIIDTVLLPQ